MTACAVIDIAGWGIAGIGLGLFIVCLIYLVMNR